jgi:hypothetical protein
MTPDKSIQIIHFDFGSFGKTDRMVWIFISKLEN